MTGAPATKRGAAVWPLLAAVAVLAGCTAAGIGALSVAAALTATGLPDPGPVTTLGLPFVRAAGEVAAVVAVGAFLFAAFLVPPQNSGVLDVDGYRAVRIGTVAAGAWAVCAALLVPLTISDVSGQPISAHLNPATIWSLASLINIATAWRLTALLAAVVMLASLPVLRWSWTPLLLAASLVTLVPLGLTGHSSAGGSHDLATNSLLIHLVAASLWAGGLLALLAHVIRGGQPAHVAARRACPSTAPPTPCCSTWWRGACGPVVCWRCWPTSSAADSTPSWPRGGSPSSRCGALSRWRSAESSTPWCGFCRRTC